MSGLDSLEAYVFKDLKPMEFFTLQAHENFHESIPAKDEARAIKRQWDDSHILGFSFTMAEFAKEIRMGETKVRDALRFAQNLDHRVQDMVDEGRLPYKIGVRLSAIQDPEEQLRLTVEILSRKDGLSNAEEIIHKFHLESKEVKLFEMTMEEWHGNMRQLVASGIRQAAKDGLAYIERVLFLVDKGLLPKNVLWSTELPLIQDLIHVSQRVRRRILRQRSV